MVVEFNGKNNANWWYIRAVERWALWASDSWDINCFGRHGTMRDGNEGCFHFSSSLFWRIGCLSNYQKIPVKSRHYMKQSFPFLLTFFCVNSWIQLDKLSYVIWAPNNSCMINGTCLKFAFLVLLLANSIRKLTLVRTDATFHNCCFSLWKWKVSSVTSLWLTLRTWNVCEMEVPMLVIALILGNR